MALFLTFLVILAYVIWLITLISHLRRKDLNDCDKIVWTVVLCTLQIFGMILYWIMASQGSYKVRTEQELKDYFNSRR